MMLKYLTKIRNELTSHGPPQNTLYFERDSKKQSLTTTNFPCLKVYTTFVSIFDCTKQALLPNTISLSLSTPHSRNSSHTTL